jgi:hypothetical protein
VAIKRDEDLLQTSTLRRRRLNGLNPNFNHFLTEEDS